MSKHGASYHKHNLYNGLLQKQYTQWMVSEVQKQELLEYQKKRESSLLFPLGK